MLRRRVRSRAAGQRRRPSRSSLRPRRRAGAAAPEPAGEVPWWSPRVPADFGGSPRPPIGSAPSVRSAAFADSLDDRPDRRRTRPPAAPPATLGRRGRRLGEPRSGSGPDRHRRPAIELAKLREHRLRDPLGALRATGRRPRPRRAAARAWAVPNRAWRPTCAPALDACDDGSSGGPRPQPARPTSGRRGSGVSPDQRDRTWSSVGSNEQAIVRRSPASALR